LTNAVLSAQLEGTYSNGMTFSNTTNSFSGNGSGLTELNASALASGTVPGAQLGGSYPNAVTFNNSGNSFTGNGNGLTNLNASALTSGTVPDDVLSDDVPLLNADQTFSSQNTFDDDVTFNQDILMGGWDIGIDEYNGIPDILTFSQDGNYRMVVLPEGYGSGDGSDAVYGMYIYGNVGCDSIDLSDGNGVIAGVTEIEGDGDGDDDAINIDGANINGSLGADEIGVSGDVAIEGDLTVGGTINGGDGDSGDSATVAKTTLDSSSTQNILGRVAQLEISSWNSKPNATNAASHHISPKAHDFNTAFGFNNSGHNINLVDEEGVALAAIQALNQKLDEKDAQMKTLQKQMADLEALVKSQNVKPEGGKP
jgi:hypothetical protein